MSTSESAGTSYPTPEARTPVSGHHSGRAGHPGSTPDPTGNAPDTSVASTAGPGAVCGDPGPATETLAWSLDDPPTFLTGDEIDGVPLVNRWRAVDTVDPEGGAL